MEHHSCSHDTCAEHRAKEIDETAPATETVPAVGSGARAPFPLGSAMIAFSLLVLAGAIIYEKRAVTRSGENGTLPANVAPAPAAADAAGGGALEEAVIPSAGVYIPVRWGDLGKRLTETGVIDRQKFDALYAARGGLSAGVQEMLDGTTGDRITITKENSGEILNILWALGLANKNKILEEGPMQDPQYGGAGRFASTGGWTLAKGDAMDHYSKYSLITLDADQQSLVERVAQGIYRPCCGNSTFFPDCNHGMAMLGLLELMASQGVSEDNMYRAALKVNSYWFPDTYVTVAKYLENKGIAWDEADPKEVLGQQVSSAQGYRQILTQVQPVQRSSGGGCGV